MIWQSKIRNISNNRFCKFKLFSINRKGLYISDIPIHDATRDLVLLSEKFEAGYKLTRNLEILTDKLQQTYRELDSEKKKTDRWAFYVYF